MAQQEEGWPLGLQPLNVRRNHGFSGSISFNTLLTGSPTCSSDSSSDLDTQSTGSFFHDRSITLGTLMGISNIVQLSRRSLRGKPLPQTLNLGNKKRYPKPKTWCFCLCPRDNIDVEIANNNTLPLGHFLAVERRAAANEQCRRRSHNSPLNYGPDELSMTQPYASETNSLFVDGCIAPPRSSPWSGSDATAERNGAPLLFSCFCGQTTC